MALVTKEYHCETCGDFELLQNHKEQLKRCPKCDSIEIERVISCPIISKDGSPKTVGSLIEQNNRRNPLSRERVFGVDAEKKMKARERMKKIQNLTPEQTKKFIEKGTL